VSDVPQLWAIHVLGPDDILAVESREAGEVWARQLNETFEAYRAENPNPLAPRMRVEVVPWRGTAEAHAEELVRIPDDLAEEAAALSATRTESAGGAR
jgi:hypothetical protein